MDSRPPFVPGRRELNAPRTEPGGDTTGSCPQSCHFRFHFFVCLVSTLLRDIIKSLACVGMASLRFTAASSILDAGTTHSQSALSSLVFVSVREGRLLSNLPRTDFKSFLRLEMQSTLLY